MLRETTLKPKNKKGWFECCREAREGGNRLRRPMTMAVPIVEQWIDGRDDIVELGVDDVTEEKTGRIGLAGEDLMTREDGIEWPRKNLLRQRCRFGLLPRRNQILSRLR